MFNLSELVRLGTLCLAKAGLAIDSSAEKFKIAAPNGAGVDYCINGVMYHKADATALTFTSGHAQQAELTSCIYLITLDSSGNVVTVQGNEVLTAKITAKSRTLEWPMPAAGYCPIGAIRIDTGDGYTFTAGTTELSATGITDTYYDIFALPAALTS